MNEQAFNGAARPRPSVRRGARPQALLALALAGALAAAACDTLPSGGGLPLPERIGGGGDQAPADDRQAMVDRTVTPPHRAAEADQLVRVGLLLPLSARDAEARADALSMFNAAQLALFETDASRLVLIPKDTGGTVDGARSQAREVLREGADVILGPLYPGSTRAVAEEAAAYNVPVISFSDDPSVAETGAYLLAVTPEEETARIVDYACLQGVVTFAAFTPDSVLGERVRTAAEQAARDCAGFLVTWEVYPDGGDSAMVDLPARRLARYDSRLAARAADQEEEFELPYEAIVLPEGGVRLLSVAPLLPFYDVDPRVTHFLGASEWRDPELAREPSLTTGWFPGPDADAIAIFEASYLDNFGAAPSRLAPLAYDAVLMTSSLTRGLGAAGLNPAGFERPTGFRGADGLFRFNGDRLSQHALAIYEVRNGGFVVIQPAPDTFEPVAF